MDTFLDRWLNDANLETDPVAALCRAAIPDAIPDLMFRIQDKEAFIDLLTQLDIDIWIQPSESLKVFAVKMHGKILKAKYLDNIATPYNRESMLLFKCSKEVEAFINSHEDLAGVAKYTEISVVSTLETLYVKYDGAWVRLALLSA